MEASSKPKLRRHRRNRRSRRKFKLLLTVVGLLSFLLGAILIMRGTADANRRMLFVGLGYAVCAGIAALIYLGAQVLWRLRRRRPQVHFRPQEGFALLLVLILLGIMAGPAYQTLVYAVTALRHAERAQQRLALRAAATDAAWTRLRSLVLSGRSIRPDSSAAEQASPDGIVTRIASRNIQQSELPAALAPTNALANGTRFYLVQTRATRGAHEFAVEAYLRQEPQSGSGGVLAWIER
jgi:type II secretory pathway pseudopilin PulG